MCIYFAVFDAVFCENSEKLPKVDVVSLRFSYFQKGDKARKSKNERENDRRPLWQWKSNKELNQLAPGSDRIHGLWISDCFVIFFLHFFFFFVIVYWWAGMEWGWIGLHLFTVDYQQTIGPLFDCLLEEKWRRRQEEKEEVGVGIEEERKAWSYKLASLLNLFVLL